MDHYLHLILYGCNLTTNLQSNLSNLTDQPNILLNSCEEIVRVFNQAIDRLKAENPSSLGESSKSRQLEFGRGTDEIDTFELKSLGGMNPFAFDVSTGSIQPEFGFGNPTLRCGGVVTEHISSSGAAALTLPEGEFPVMGGSDSGKRPLMEEQGFQTRRKRDERSKVWVPVSSTRNPETPPEDGFAWRKYGRKSTQGSIFLRSYYRCKAPGCTAKKNVQRLNDDPNTIEVTYYGDPHTCGSSTAVPPPASGLQLMVVATQPPPSSTSIHHINWISAGFEAPLHVQRHVSTPTETSTSHVRTATVSETPVTDLPNLANWFLSPYSSSNSMDSIFPSTGDD